MAYHVSLVNTDKKDISSKLIMNKEKFREFLLREFNMKEELNENGVLEFYYDKDDPSFTIFYTEGIEGEYYINTTDDNCIKKLLSIAEKLNDGTRVRGDEGETYNSLEDTYIHSDDVLLNNITFIDRIKIGVKANICLIIWGIISLVIILCKIINDHIQ